MTVDNFKGKSLAVVIGIDDYRNGVPSLKTPVNDAQTLATILQDQHGYDVKLLLNKEANGTALKDLLETELPQRLSKDDRLLFYFAGHGIALNGDDGPEGYLIPSDASLGNINTYVSMATVNKALLKLTCRHFLGILDCCFAGAFRWSSTRKLVPIELGTLHQERYDRFIRDPAWQVITSAASDQYAQDAFSLKNSTQRGLQGNHSPFAAALIEALERDTDTASLAEVVKPAINGVITASALYSYLRNRVEPYTEKQGMRQTPGIFPLTKHDKGEFIFWSPGHPLNLPPAPPLDESSNPYRGLESFDEAHKDLFFGRQSLTDTLAEFVTNHALTVVLGASGSGKSSLVKAGLIPKLQQADGWAFLSPFRPGESPFKALNQVLQVANLPEIAPAAEAPSLGLLTPTQGLSLWFQEHPHTHLLVVVDQFEELITLCRDQQERKEFLDVLAEAIATHPTQLHLVLTLRSDFEPSLRSAFEPSLRSAFERQSRKSTLEISWQDARFVVPAMTRDELRQAIEAPASARVMVFDPHELVDQLIDEVANMPGALPLLSFALSELYLNYLRRRDDAWNKKSEIVDRAMTQADYEAMGGVTRSLTQRAERVYEELVQDDPDYEQTIRNVMLRMVSIGGELARRRVPLSELDYPDAAENGRVKEAIKRFEDARLLTPDTDPEGKPYKEPAHDALVRGWPRLLDWKQKHLRELLLQRDLTSDANQWESSGKKKQDSGLLWIEDPRLPTALQLSCGKDYKDNWLNLFRWSFGYQTWRSQTPEHWFNTSETDFVGQSFDQKFKRFRNTTIIVAGVILTLSGLTGYAFVQQGLATQSAQEANKQKDEAKKQAGIALNNQEKAETNQKEAEKQQKEAEKQTTIALTNQKEAEKQRKEAEKQTTIALTNQKEAEKQRNQAVSARKLAEERKLIAEERLKVANARKLAVQAEVAYNQQLFFLPRSLLLAVESMRLYPSIEAEQTLRQGMALLPRLVTSIPFDKNIKLVTFSANGKYFATISSKEQLIYVREIVTGKEIAQIEITKPVKTIALSPDGSRLAIVDTTQTQDVVVLQATTGKIVATLPQKRRVDAMIFSTDGSRLYLSTRQTLRESSDRLTPEIWVWEAFTNTTVRIPDALTPLAFAADRKYAVRMPDGYVQILDASNPQKKVRLPVKLRAASYDISFSPDSKFIATVSNDGPSGITTAQLWDISSLSEESDNNVRETARLIQSEQSISRIIISPDGKHIATIDSQSAKLWQVMSGGEVARIAEKGKIEAKIEVVNLNGDFLTTSITESNSLRFSMRSAATGKLVSGVLDIPKDRKIEKTALSPDGKYLAAVTSHANQYMITKWEILSGGIVSDIPIRDLLNADDQPLNIAFSDDQQLYLAAANLSRDKASKQIEVKTLEVASKHLLSRIVIQTPDRFSKLAFSTNGQYLVSTIFNLEVKNRRITQLKAWKTITGQVVNQFTLPANLSNVTSLSLSPDGSYVATTDLSNSQRVRIWQLSTGQTVSQVETASTVSQILLSQKYLFTEEAHFKDFTNFLGIWLWQPKDLIDEACHHLSRNLTQYEWNQYLGTEPYHQTCPGLPIPKAAEDENSQASIWDGSTTINRSV